MTEYSPETQGGTGYSSPPWHARSGPFVVPSRRPCSSAFRAGLGPVARISTSSITGPGPDRLDHRGPRLDHRAQCVRVSMLNDRAAAARGLDHPSHLATLLIPKTLRPGASPPMASTGLSSCSMGSRTKERPIESSLLAMPRNHQAGSEPFGCGPVQRNPAAVSPDLSAST